RVVRVLPGMQAAFVDIGLDKAAFLYVSDVFYDPDFSEQQFEITEGEHPEGGDVPEELAAAMAPRDADEEESEDEDEEEDAGLELAAADVIELQGAVAEGAVSPEGPVATRGAPGGVPAAAEATGSAEAPGPTPAAKERERRPQHGARKARGGDGRKN